MCMFAVLYNTMSKEDLEVDNNSMTDSLVYSLLTQVGFRRNIPKTPKAKMMVITQMVLSYIIIMM